MDSVSELPVDGSADVARAPVLPKENRSDDDGDAEGVGKKFQENATKRRVL